MSDPKFIFAVIVLAAATGLRLLGDAAGITSTNWVSVAIAVVCAFIGGQVAAVLASGWELQQKAKAERGGGEP